MKQIIYTFNDKTTSTVEVSEEFYQNYEQMEKEENLRNRKETRRHISIDSLKEQGIEFEELDINPEEITIKNDTRKQVQEVIKQLTPNQQELIISVYFQNKSMAEIAREKGVSKSAITQQMQVILKHLKINLKNF